MDENENEDEDEDEDEDGGPLRVFWGVCLYIRSTI